MLVKYTFTRCVTSKVVLSFRHTSKYRAGRHSFDSRQVRIAHQLLVGKSALGCGTEPSQRYDNDRIIPTPIHQRAGADAEMSYC